MKVAIWGSYNYGNYGDDIMAIQFAHHLKSLGADPYVFQLNQSLAKLYSINVANSWDELFKDAKFCLIGGGGVLVDGVTPKVDQEFELLALTSEKYNCPVFPISIGGEGKGSEAVLSPKRLAFFKSNFCQESTVRLKEDLDLFEKLGKSSVYYPDVLLTVSDFWKIPPKFRTDEKLHVGINLPNSFQGQLLFMQLRMINSFQDNIVFHFISTYLPDSSITWEFLPKSESALSKKHIYTDPYLTLEFLSSLDLLISYKLHLGLTALALGVPFYSVGGPGKAQGFLKSINASSAIFPANFKRWKLGSYLSNPDNIRAARKHFDFSLIEQLKKVSWGHMDQITKIVNSMDRSVEN